MDILIAGGGIGGLTAALALERFGHSVRVVEQAGVIQEVGAGLQISPNGMRVLNALGLSARVMRDAFRPEGIEMRMGRSGRVVFDVPLRRKGEGRWGAEYVHLHRADLIEALKDMLLERVPDALLLGRQVERYMQDGEGVQLHLVGGEVLKADILVAADGIHSIIREQMLGPDEARFTGNVAWRATVPMTELGDLSPPATACAWVGSKRHAVTYRLRRGSLANFVGVVERRDWKVESWVEQGTREEALKDFHKWNPIIRRIIERADVLNRWALFDRDPLESWYDGRVVLLGDACHPMLPFLAQGAVMSIEDAFVLAHALKVTNSVDDALADYEARRKPRTAKVQAGARANAKLFHRAGVVGSVATFGPMAIGARMAPEFVKSRLDWIYGYDVTDVPAENPSTS